MNLEIVRKLSENRGGGLKKLAADVGMSEQNLHRCIRNNKIQAADLEKIAFLLKADIRIFFDDEVSRLSNNTVETNGDFSPASMMGNVSVGTDAILVERVKHLEELRRHAENQVAFVGDGINDAPVLTTADVGIAMGAMGSDVAIESADVVLMNDNPSAIATAKKISRKTMRIVKENIIVSKFAVLILSAVGVLDKISFGLIIAVLADVGVCFVAILNAMRAMFVKGK